MLAVLFKATLLFCLELTHKFTAYIYFKRMNVFMFKDLLEDEREKVLGWAVTMRVLMLPC